MFKNIFHKKNNFGIKNRIYFDSASAVPVLDIAKKSFLETLSKSFANASSIHAEGEKAKEILFEARKKIAKFVHAKSANIHFTASTTEANNIFIKGVVLSWMKEKSLLDPKTALAGRENSFLNPEKSFPHIIFSKSDHSAIVDVVESCKLFGGEVTSVMPNKIGLLQPEEIVKQIKENTVLICFSYVSSELGTIQPVRKIAQAVEEYCKTNFPEKKKENYPKIFIDATQAIKYENTDVGILMVDGMSFGSSKVGGLSGAAVLYVRNGVKLEPIISGGGQEDGVRSGTENLPAIVAMSEVLHTKPKEYVYSLRNYAIEKLRENFSEKELEIFGDIKFKYNKFFEHSAPHILLLSLVDMLGEETLLRLDAKGISVSTASACSLLENSGSSFLRTVGEPVKAKETIRLSFSEDNTKEEIDYFVKVLKDIKDNFVK